MEVINNTILKPTQLPSTVEGTVVPLTIFDKAAFDLHVSILYAYRAPVPSNAELIHGLAKVLSHYPHLTGRMIRDSVHGHQSIVLNGEGIRLVETIITSTLAERMPFEPSHELTKLHPPIEGVEELLQIQLNRYSCGGLVIGLTSHHRVADGQSMSSFFVSWARTVKGLEVDHLPCLNRAAVTIPRSPPVPEFNHRAIEFIDRSSSPPSPPNAEASNIVNLVIHYSPDFMSKLKKHVTDDAPDMRCTTFQCLLTHVWKKMTLARGLGEDEMTQVRVAVNGRARIKPAVPMEYFGNLVLWAYPRMQVKDLINQSYGSIVKAIHEAVSRVDSSYFQSFIDFGELADEEGMVESAPEMGNMLCPNLEVDSWLSFRFHELDFGGGAPCSFLPSELPVEGLLLFVPSCKEKGGVDVFIAAAEEHVEQFKTISHSLVL